MPYRFPGSKRSQFQRTRQQASLVGQPDYGPVKTGVWRHEYNAQLEGTQITAGEYVEVPIIRFARSFSGTADDPPSPTSGNNYQVNRVFNGSRIQRLNNRIQIKSQQVTPDASAANQTFGIDVYEIALSFYEGYLWNALSPTTSPIDYDTTSTDEGEVDFKGTPITLTANTYKNSKFTQHFMKYRGRINVGAGETAVINLNRIPPKCRRANVGMFWGVVLHNETSVNDSANFPCSILYEASFEEIPSENRLPWLY